MIAHAEIVALKIGFIDALLFFVVWSCVGLATAAQPSGALPIIVFLLVPASALVGWRGAASVRLILAGTASLRRAVIEGFAYGAAFVFVIWLWGASNAALAAGTVFDGLSPRQPEFWVTVAKSLLPALGIGGSIGSLHGIVLLYVNRRLVRANPFINTDRRDKAAPAGYVKR